jgi:hypothetical protein
VTIGQRENWVILMSVVKHIGRARSARGGCGDRPNEGARRLGEAAARDG